MKQSLFESEPDAFPTGVFVQIAVERGYDRGSADAALTYAAHDPAIEVGQSVEAPLGRGNTPTRGVVIARGGEELLAGLTPGRLKRTTRILGTPLTADLVELARWMSRYYLCPLGMTLASMVPAAVKQDIGRRTQTLLVRGPESDGDLPKLSPTAARAWSAVRELDAEAWPASARELADAIGERSIAPINRLIRAGLLVEQQATTVRARDDDADSVFAAPSAPEPTDEQSAAIKAVGATLGSFAQHLLFGVTGSGKTEVYLRLLERVLERGESAVMLVPEIALTPQTAGRVQSRLGAERVAVLHSGLTAAQRNRAWSRVSSGTCLVVVGARSAVFAPVTNLGLIIVDEEHDGSYKQDQLPRYHARDVAIKRAHDAGCPVLLGSATPSLESWRNAKTGRSTLHRLSRRIGGARLPRVRIVDMAAERRLEAEATGRTSPETLVGPTLARAIRATIDRGGQMVLLLNRRGFAGVVACPKAACEFRLTCAHCDANLVLHKDSQLRAGGFVRCHHCHAEQRLPEKCPSCGGGLRLMGSGTQKAERVLEDITADLPREQRLIAGESLIRVDADTMRTARHYFETLSRFARGEVRALLGTQMIAKGLDVPGVQLVGVLSADTALSLPDFRAGERTFQLVSQVAGRAGRGVHAGEVIVQTYEPDASCIRLAAQHAYERFADEEMALRAAVGLPPAWRMARVVCRDADAARARSAADEIAEAARDRAATLGARLDGPMPCPIDRIADHFRFAVELVAPTAGIIQDILRGLREAGLVKSDARTAVDVDPVSLM
ncbi:MAG: replication restart helicase PriA [Phycisphaerales bacterium]